MFNKHMFSKPYVQQTLCSRNLCSTNPIFNVVQQTLCATNPMFNKPMFNKPYVQQTLCSTNPMFNKRMSKFIWGWRWGWSMYVLGFHMYKSIWGWSTYGVGEGLFQHRKCNISVLRRICFLALYCVGRSPPGPNSDRGNTHVHQWV